MEHVCHAIGCTTPIKPEKLMCMKHWQMVPRVIQKDVWLHYRDGQCNDKKPSTLWLKAAKSAITYVANLEKKNEQPT